MEFRPLALAGETPAAEELRQIARAKTTVEMASLEDASGRDFSPTYDDSPYFFNSVHVRNLGKFLAAGGGSGNLLAILVLFAFFLAAAVLVFVTVVLPAQGTRGKRSRALPAPAGGIVYFIAIGIGFMFAEIAMMQQLSIFLGHPVYSLVVVLGGLVLSAGVGSLLSDRLPTTNAMISRVPAAAVAVAIVAYSQAVVPVSHAFTAAALWQRVCISLLLVAPCGLLAGFCFPTGMRWLAALKQEQNLPWMWALNGAAGTLGSFAAVLVSMDTTVGTCALVGAGCYLLASVALPSRAPAAVQQPILVQPAEAA
jgi:hypothetical protein